MDKEAVIVNQVTREVKNIRHLTEHAYVLRFDKGDFKFRAGQYLTVGINNTIQQREYSIYSGEEEAFLEILVREILEGNVSKSLKNSRESQELLVEGPFGFMTLDETDIKTKKFVFIASGTGVAPFHSFVRSYPGLDYKIIHGVRYAEEAYDRDEYADDRYVLCTSRDTIGDFKGRVTAYLEASDFDKETLFYACGNSQMIYEAYDILRNKGIDSMNMHSEVYF